MTRSRYPDDRTAARHRWAENKLQHEFSDDALLTRALTHRSASKLNNERLEFLGDAVLNFCVARALFDASSGADEGELSRGRAALVNKRRLATVGRSIEVDGQLILGSGELRSGGAQRDAALANAVEALIGAVLLDGGFDAAARVVDLLIAPHLEELPDGEALKDPKTRLQEWLQGRGHGLPAYTVDDVSGSDHDRHFVVACQVDVLGLRSSGHGSSRRRAEQDAAARMLDELADV